MIKFKHLAATLLLACALPTAALAHEGNHVVKLATTTSTDNSGLAGLPAADV